MLEWKDFDDPEAELKKLRAASETSPDNPDIHFKLAEVYVFIRSCDNAVDHCLKAMELDPEQDSIPLYYEFLAHAYKRDADWAKAAEYYEKLTRLEDPESEHFFELFDLYSVTGDKENAARTVERMKPHVSDDIFTEYKKYTE